MRRGMRFGFAASIASGALLAAVVAPPSGLAAMSLKLESGGTGLVGNTPMSLVSTELNLSNAFWNIGCSQVTLSGAVDQNHKGKGDGMVITEGLFGGGGEEGLCAGSPEFVTTFKPVQTPELSLSNKGKALLRYMALRLVPRVNREKPENHQEPCIASATTLRGTFPVSTVAQPLTITFTAAKMKLKAEGPECGTGLEAKPHLTVTFTATTRGAPVEVVLY